MARQLQYEVRWVAISQYYYNYRNMKMPKEVAREEHLTLTREQYLLVSITDLSFRCLWEISLFRVDMPLCFHYVGVSWLVLWKKGIMGGIG
jgi:hypothetical protein